MLGRESGGLQALDRSQPMMLGMPRRSHDYGRHGVTGLFAAFDIADGTVISELHRQHRAVERADPGKGSPSSGRGCAAAFM